MTTACGSKAVTGRTCSRRRRTHRERKKTDELFAFYWVSAQHSGRSGIPTALHPQLHAIIQTLSCTAHAPPAARVWSACPVQNTAVVKEEVTTSFPLPVTACQGLFTDTDSEGAQRWRRVFIMVTQLWCERGDYWDNCNWFTIAESFSETTTQPNAVADCTL